MGHRVIVNIIFWIFEVDGVSIAYCIHVPVPGTGTRYGTGCSTVPVLDVRDWYDDDVRGATYLYLKFSFLA